MDLKEYERTKFELAAALREIQTRAKTPTAEQENGLRALFARLAEDRFNLVVVGRFSRGKTSLMNAILGSESLPMGIVPLTSVITAVTYASRPGVTVKYQDNRLENEVPLEALEEYVTSRGNPGNVRRVVTAEVKLPAEILRRGFYFVDTPGLGSTIRENTRTTQTFLPQADAFVLVTSYESPLSEEEFDLLRAACASARRAFVVLNKQDIVSTAEREEARRYVESRLAELPGAAPPALFSVSARDALAATRTADPERLAASGVPALQEAIVRFLVAEKTAQFLARIGDRAADLARELLAPEAAVRVIARIAALASAGGARTVDAETAVGRTGNEAALGDLRRPDPCEVCGNIVQAAFDFLRRFQYRLGTEGEEQVQHAERGGLCALHTWQYAALAGTQGVCTGYPALLERLSQLFRAAPANSPATLGSTIRALPAGLDRCVVCHACAEAEAGALAEIARRLETAEVVPQALSALCLPHLGMLMARLRDAKVAERLMRREAELLERLAEDMRRYATKRDALRRYLASDEERQAAERAIAALVGLRNVNRAARLD
jgi:ribosome biogenesis GTPase A